MYRYNRITPTQQMLNERHITSLQPGDRHRMPVWLKWIIAVVIVCVYVWGFYTFFVSPTGFRWRALYGDAKYPEGYEIHGIDISHYQGKIDWDLLRNAMITRCPLRFVIVKSTEGADHVDENFRENFHFARETGFLRGAYHFWSNKTPAKKQARFFIEQVHLEEGDLPPILDVEHKPQDKTIAELQEQILEWLQIMEQHYHTKPIIYTYYRFKQQFLDDERFDRYPYWIAHYYVDRMEYDGPWKFWQHTDAGRLPGIRGNVDLDIYNGSYYDLLQLTIRKTVEK